MISLCKHLRPSYIIERKSMRQITLLTCILFFSTGFANGQQAAKSVFAELLGPGLASINYDMRLQPGESGIGFRAGIGGLPVNTVYDDGTNTYTERRSVITIPLGLNYLLGKNDKHYFELGQELLLFRQKDRQAILQDGRDLPEA